MQKKKLSEITSKVWLLNLIWLKNTTLSAKIGVKIIKYCFKLIKVLSFQNFLTKAKRRWGNLGKRRGRKRNFMLFMLNGLKEFKRFGCSLATIMTITILWVCLRRLNRIKSAYSSSKTKINMMVKFCKGKLKKWSSNIKRESASSRILEKQDNRSK